MKRNIFEKSMENNDQRSVKFELVWNNNNEDVYDGAFGASQSTFYYLKLLLFDKLVCRQI